MKFQRVTLPLPLTTSDRVQAIHVLFEFQLQQFLLKVAVGLKP